MTPERIEELVRQGLAFDAVADARGQIEMTIRQAIKEASATTEALLPKALKVATEFTDKDGVFDLYLGETFLGRYEQEIVTPLANAINNAVKAAVSPQPLPQGDRSK